VVIQATSEHSVHTSLTGKASDHGDPERIGISFARIAAYLLTVSSEGD
jgi:hypothetical protein